MLKNVAIAGAGTMGASMALIFADNGYAVTLYDISGDALERAKRLVGLSAAAGGHEEHSEITYTSDSDALSGADFLIEAISENIDIKHEFWKKASALVSKEALLASNTSGLSITSIAEAVACPERFAGMHWMNPPHIIPLIEIIKGERTSEETMTAVSDIALSLKKKPVRVKDAPSFVLNRLQQAVLREALYIVEEGIASPQAVDDVMKYALGFRYACFGPFEICDLGGLDIHYNISKYTFADLCDRKEPFGLLEKCVSDGRLGVKNGAGFYDYPDGKGEELIIRRDRLFTELAKLLYGKSGGEGQTY